MTPLVTRRAFIRSMSFGVACAATSSPVVALAGQEPSLVLYDPTLGTAEQLGLQTRGAAGTVLQLVPDIVRSWRDGLGQQVLGNQRSLAITRWAGAQVLAGLVREEGGKARLHRVGRDVFEVCIDSPMAGSPAPATPQDRLLQER
jgi:hypothetical protein